MGHPESTAMMASLDPRVPKACVAIVDFRVTSVQSDRKVKLVRVEDLDRSVPLDRPVPPASWVPHS
ncbi:unnamed protein product [Dibothriocephalus latus]|uniref:Uncharacterized protein n=1 Tax=Dibothriocephalus latus TaxID=60516 RepID=A0A3P7MHK3_DIBLA|nr:unnamed protein product [Dibothriocephalus latus]